MSKKVRYNFTLDEEVLEMLKSLAAKHNRSVSNWLEWRIQYSYLEEQTKGQTKDSIDK